MAWNSFIKSESYVDHRLFERQIFNTDLEKLFHSIYLDHIEQVQTSLEHNDVNYHLLGACDLCSTEDKSHKGWHLT